jgi:uncharacterized protein GlcG (DUF336 family)
MVKGFITFPGGLPSNTADGALTGGIGVSGGPPNIDEECAQSGLDGAKDMLTAGALWIVKIIPDKRLPFPRN